MFSGNLPYLLFHPRLERVRQDVNAQRGPAGVGRHRVRQGFELGCDRDDRRFAPGRHDDGVVNAPGGARASIAKAEQCQAPHVAASWSLVPPVNEWYGTDVPRLLAEVRRLRAENEKLLGRRKMPR